MLFVMFDFNICLLGRTDMGPFWLPTCTAMGRISMACGGVSGAFSRAFQAWGKTDQGCDLIDVNEIIAYFQSRIERDARCRYGLACEVPPES